MLRGMHGSADACSCKQPAVFAVHTLVNTAAATAATAAVQHLKQQPGNVLAKQSAYATTVSLLLLPPTIAGSTH